ncbi:MAG: glycosyltransferase family 2 protein [Pseudomonadota bacterium]
MSLSRLPVTVVVPVKNEEANLHACLSQLSSFEQIVVVDSSSTDRTPEIAAEFGAKYLNFTWDGKFPKKRNWVLTNHPPETDWVLFLDADEIIDQTFCDELAETLAVTKHSAFWLNFSNYFLGKELKHGVPQRKLALFRVGSGLYERIEEDGWSTLDMEIHEHPVIEGSVGEIKAQIEHNDDRGISKFIERHRNYAMWEAKRVKTLRAKGAEMFDDLTPRQRSKYKNIDKWWFCWSYFVLTYVIRLGFLDGRTGFDYAFYKFWYFRTIRLMIEDDRRGAVS